MTKNTADWIENRIKKDEVTPWLEDGRDFINDTEIENILTAQQEPDPEYIDDILAKSMAVETLTPAETAALLNVSDPDVLNKMKETAARVKKKVYDNRIVTFAPLYLNNQCVNNCHYCGFRRDNTEVERKILSPEEIKKETEILAGDIGHKRLIVVYGESPVSDVNYMVD
ncbi:MAG: radical SAM protein [bacterium]